MTTNPARTLAERLPGDTSANTGAVRVGANATVIAAVVWTIERATAYDIDADNPAFIAAAGAVVAVGYRLSRVIAGKFPAIGWALFGIGSEPSY